MLNSNLSRQFDWKVETKSWNRCFPLSDDSPCLFVCLLQTHGQTRENTKIPVFSNLFSLRCTSVLVHRSFWPLACHALMASLSKCDTFCHTLWHICHISISHSVRWRNKKLTLDFCHGGVEERRPYWCGGCRRPSLGRLRPIEWPQYSGLSKGLIVASAEAHHWATGPHQRLLLRFIHKQSSGSKINSQEFSMHNQYWELLQLLMNAQPQYCRMNVLLRNGQDNGLNQSLTGQRVYCMKCIVLYWNQKFTYCNTFATETISQLTELHCCYILNFLVRGRTCEGGVVYAWRPLERFCLNQVTNCHILWHAASN